ncbi:MAG: gliding motility-associated peptidyl-prolyl isomerase GldI [Flavobacteriales bacterium]|nr:gliding motility-associated peptidyl-prolyl isomerase GldI [Flavobacteriales bacterium]MBS4039986.1 gliding motility-associated peptidyl-prolyl isomerase GldI [Flavobacteriales bacterium]
MHIIKIVSLFVLFTLLSCKEKEPRKPVNRSKGTFMKESVQRNLLLVAEEEKIIDSLMKAQPELKFQESQKGFWFAITEPNDQEKYYPQKNDVVFFTYEIQDLYGEVIYSREQLKPQTYLVDKQNIMIGLRYGIKKLKIGESGIFYFPSHMGFGYHGDDRDIPPNLPLKVLVTITDIKPENKN